MGRSGTTVNATRGWTVPNRETRGASELELQRRSFWASPLTTPAERISDAPDDPESESPTRTLRGRPGVLAAALAGGLSAYALYWVVGIVQPQVYRVTFLMIALALTFLVYPARRSPRQHVEWLDWLLLGLGVISLAWPLIDFDRFVYRAATPTGLDLVLGVITIVLVLEATRRTVGWILPATAMAFLVYGYLGPLLGFVGLGLFAHRGYSIARLVGTLYMTLEGIFGVPLDVAATYIILFTIYGAVLQQSGAGQFFISWAMAAMGKSESGAGPGILRTTLTAVAGISALAMGLGGWLRRAANTPERVLATTGVLPVDFWEHALVPRRLGIIVSLAGGSVFPDGGLRGDCRLDARLGGSTASPSTRTSSADAARWPESPRSRWD